MLLGSYRRVSETAERQAASAITFQLKQGQLLEPKTKRKLFNLPQTNNKDKMVQGWGDVSMGKLLAVRAGGLSLDPLYHVKAGYGRVYLCLNCLSVCCDQIARQNN